MLVMRSEKPVLSQFFLSRPQRSPFLVRSARVHDGVYEVMVLTADGEDIVRTDADLAGVYVVDLDRLASEKIPDYPGGDFAEEQRALGRAFDNYQALGFEGLLLRSGGRTVAFTMGARIRADVFDVNFEKAVTDVQGAYAMVNRTFARFLCEKYPFLNFLNREDDMGIEGLRKAKLSYYPDLLLRKWVTISTPEAVLR